MEGAPRTRVGTYLNPRNRLAPWNASPNAVEVVRMVEEETEKLALGPSLHWRAGPSDIIVLEELEMETKVCPSERTVYC